MQNSGQKPLSHRTLRSGSSRVLGESNVVARSVHRTTSDASFAEELNEPIKVSPVSVLPGGGAGVASPAAAGPDYSPQHRQPAAAARDSDIPDTSRILSMESTAHLQAALGSSSSAPLTPTRKKSVYLRLSDALLKLTYLGVIAMSCLMMWYISIDSAEIHVFAWAVAGIFVALALPISFHDIHMHCVHYVSPLQKYIVRIILIVPIYSVESWFALRFKEQKLYLETLRETYEAYVIYNFYLMLLVFLGGRHKLAALLEERPKERVNHLPPFCCFRGWRVGSRFVHRCTVGVYQYVFLRVFVSIITLITVAAGVYNEGSYSPEYFYLYATIIINVSQVYALYCLALFYVELRGELKPLSPLFKFAVVKAIVFFSWWQGLGISILATFGVLHGDGLDYSDDDVSYGLQDFLICIEMFIAALAHHYCYSFTDFYSPVTRQATPLALMHLTDAENGAHSRIRAPPDTPASSHTATGSVSEIATPGGRSLVSHHSIRSSGSAAALVGKTASFPDSGSPGDHSTPVIVVHRASGTMAGPGRARLAANGPDATDAPSAPPAAVRRDSRHRGGSSTAGGDSYDGTPGRGAASGHSMDSIPEDASVSSEAAIANVVPAPFSTVLLELMPMDVVADTAEQLRTGFGLTHKWEKRRKEAAVEAAKLDEMVKRGHTRTMPHSKFGAVDTPTGGNYETAAPQLQPPPQQLDPAQVSIEVAPSAVLGVASIASSPPGGASPSLAAHPAAGVPEMGALDLGGAGLQGEGTPGGARSQARRTKRGAAREKQGGPTWE